MKTMQKSEAIKASLRKGLQDGGSKMAKRKCYGYTISPEGELVIEPDKAKAVVWIFARYLAGDSLGKIAAELEERGIPAPTGRAKWNREAIDKLLSNEKYTGRVLLQKTVSVGGFQFENDGFMARYLISDAHGPIISCRNVQVSSARKNETNKFSWIQTFHADTFLKECTISYNCLGVSCQG